MKAIYSENSLRGKKFGALFYLCNFHRKDTSEPFATFQCDCGGQIEANVRDVVRGKKKSCNLCFKFRRGESHYAWSGFGEISGEYWGVVKKGAAERGLKCKVSIKDVWAVFLEQDRKCALSGVPLVFGNTCYSVDTTASLDRIDSSEGYVKGNIQWVHKALNRMKFTLPQTEFIEWCHKVSKHNS